MGVSDLRLALNRRNLNSKGAKPVLLARLLEPQVSLDRPASAETAVGAEGQLPVGAAAGAKRQRRFRATAPTEELLGDRDSHSSSSSSDSSDEQPGETAAKGPGAVQSSTGTQISPSAVVSRTVLYVQFPSNQKVNRSA